MKTNPSLHKKSSTFKYKFQQHVPQKKSLTHRFYENSFILAVNDQKLKYCWMQIPANKYDYQLDSLKLSRDQKQYFNRDRWNITLVSKQ